MKIADGGAVEKLPAAQRRGRRLIRQALFGCAGALNLALALSSPSLAQQQTAPPLTAPTPSEPPTLAEVVVTASKRPERLREVANSVTAFTAADLNQIGAQSLADYIGRSPGVIFDASTPGVSNIVIRGVGTATTFPDQGQSTTGVYVNNIPLTDPGFAVSTPDLDTFDLNRVEVLRGPQGTLFGSATLGGAVNYILNPVSLTQYQAKIETSVSGVENGSQVGSTLKGVVNIPIVDDVFGVRLTAIRRFDPGYLDNIGTGRNDSNTHQVNDFRVDALWKISSDASLEFQSLYDESHNGDGFYAFPTVGNLVRDTIINETAAFNTFINSVSFSDDLHFATFSLQLANSRKAQNSLSDESAFFGEPTIGPARARTDSNNVEARLTSPSGQKLEWLVGVYYDHYSEFYPTPTLQSGQDVFDFDVSYLSREISGFGEATYHFNNQWRATFGGRYYNIDITTNTLQGDPATPPEQAATGGEKDSGFSPKGSITYEPNRNFLAYALVSKGFRAGGVNLVAPLPGFATPPTYGSDSIINYEIGLRPSWFNHRLTLDSTLFYIDWSNIQIRLARPDGFDYVANAAAARNIGLENALTWNPSRNLSLQANLTYLDAELSKSLALGDGTILKTGETLPGASHLTASEVATYRWDVNYAPYLTLSHRYISRAASAFEGPTPQGNYNVFDAIAGFSVGAADISLYADNIGDRRGITTSQFFGNDITYFYIRPRTVGIRLDYRYQ